MKAVILAGGFGTRISEESHLRPKPMIEIGGKPILWHIMKIYAAHGINEFVICLGYKGYVIKEYFANYFRHTADVTWDLSTGECEVHQQTAEPWKVTLIDTGEKAMTGGRLKAVADYVGDRFCFTYGDGVADIDITALLKHHDHHGKEATITAVQPAGRYGALDLNTDNMVQAFNEKPMGDGAWINGGFFVLEKSVIDRIDGPLTTWEQEPLIGLTNDAQLSAFHHHGFWQPMDTLREKNILEKLWASGKAPWKTWT